MNTIKLVARTKLVEHPQLPVNYVPNPILLHSYIFPGDELVMYSNINLPTDAGVASMNLIQMQDVKNSIIAEKPNIFTGIFANQFSATRSFELDSFSLAFNKINAPLVPWGTDGYAQRVKLENDRNWRLPSADFRRQIKFFTEHTASTTVWNYWFFFPILFRWEYWKALLKADNDFYDALLPNNGQSQKWFRYSNPSALPFGWLVKARTQLNLLAAGVQTTIIADLNLSNEADQINDYNANADYTLKSIKTCEVGGTPSNTPLAYVFDWQNTSCFAYFTKSSGWVGLEKDNLCGVFWVEPFEGGGVPVRTRASSQYPITPESVFIGMIEPIATSDGGVDIETDGGAIILTDNSGDGVLITFDPLDDKNIILSAEIDYVKLKAAYPSVKKFTLYARLYNSTLP